MAQPAKSQPGTGLRGIELLDDPIRSKGTAFSAEERRTLGLEGLLPYAVEGLDRQVERVIQLLGGVIGSKSPVHPNDDVNMGQSSNDTFPTAMHIAAVLELEEHLLPHAEALAGAVEAKAGEWREVVKIGRTHLEDAVPLTVGQEWSGYAQQIRDALARVRASEQGLYELAAGRHRRGHRAERAGGLQQRDRKKALGADPPPVRDRAQQVRGRRLARRDGRRDGGAARARGVVDEDRQRHALAGLRPALRDRRALVAGERAGFVHMPGKVNPTQCEAMVMVCIEVIGADNGVAFAGSQGNFELCAMRPIIINDFLHAARVLGDACDKLRKFSVEGTVLNRRRIEEMLDRSLMLVTALSPVIGYDKASAIAHVANDHGLTLREAALRSGYVDEKRYDEIVDPKKMIGHGVAGA
jgi:fumarate hydratase class II